MDKLLEICNYIIENRDIFIEAIKSLGLIIGVGISVIISLASLFIKITPVLRKDNKALPFVKFIGKYVALNKSVRREEYEKNKKSKKRKSKCF